MRRSLVRCFLPQLLRSNNAAAATCVTQAPVLQHMAVGLGQQLRNFADDANLKVGWDGQQPMTVVAPYPTHRLWPIEWLQQQAASSGLFCVQKTALYDFHVAHGGKQARQSQWNAAGWLQTII